MDRNNINKTEILVIIRTMMLQLLCTLRRYCLLQWNYEFSDIHAYSCMKNVSKHAMDIFNTVYAVYNQVKPYISLLQGRYILV